MKVILLTDIPKIGNKYDIKDFKEGYAQNVLLSKGLACLATPKELQKIESIKKAQKQKREEEIANFENLLNELNNKMVVLKAKSNEKGVLFKAITSKDICLAIKENNGLDIKEEYLKMEHIKSLGKHTIVIKMLDKSGEFSVFVEPIK